MNILLINANPVVSRLLVLCTRDDSVVLDDVANAEGVKQYDYNIVFVDEASYGRDVAELLVKFSEAKKVFISYRSDVMKGFDITIKKPFLPSQILDIIENVDISEKDALEAPTQVETNTMQSVEEIVPEKTKNESNTQEETLSIFPLDVSDEVEDKGDEVVPPAVLDEEELEKIKALLIMDENLEEREELLSEDEIEARKIEVIKEQLIADGLEIVEEDAIVEELSISLDGTLQKNRKSTTKKKKTSQKKKNSKTKQKNKKNKKIKFTQKNMERIEDAVEVAMATMTKKQMKKLLKGKEIEIHIKLEDKH